MFDWSQGVKSACSVAQTLRIATVSIEPTVIGM